MPYWDKYRSKLSDFGVIVLSFWGGGYPFSILLDLVEGKHAFSLFLDSSLMQVI